MVDLSSSFGSAIIRLAPRHVHVLKDRRLLAKVELDERLTVMEGKIDRRVREILKTLVKEGLLK